MNLNRRRSTLTAVFLLVSVVTIFVEWHADAQTRRLSIIGPAAIPTPVEAQIAPEAAAQIEALESEKANRTPAQQKLGSNLLYAIKMQRGESIADGVTSLPNGLA